MASAIIHLPQAPFLLGLECIFIFCDLHTVSTISPFPELEVGLKKNNILHGDQVSLLTVQDLISSWLAFINPFDLYFNFGTFISPSINVNYACICLLTFPSDQVHSSFSPLALSRIWPILDS